MATDNEVLKQARSLLNARLELITALKSSYDDEQQKRAALAEAERKTAADYAAALQAGWTPQELRQMGFRDPARARPGRPRGSSSKGKNANPAPPSPGTPSSPSSGTNTVPGQTSGQTTSV